MNRARSITNRRARPAAAAPSLDLGREAVLRDYRIGWSAAAQASLLGRKEVLTGKAKFGIFGDGKEVAAARDGARLPAGRLPLRLLPRPDAS